ncbi:uncharacterized protein METZ01_LOCUS421349, partial [marine metagenome]
NPNLNKGSPADMKIPFIKRVKNLKIDSVFVTDVGLKRSNNEDSGISVSGPESPSGTQGVFIVADGMGGHESGEVASSMAVESLLGELTNMVEDITIPPGGYSELIRRMVRNANAKIRKAGKADKPQSMGTTCTACVVKDRKAHIVHVGDSRAYLLRDGDLRQLTEDHSYVAEQVALGRMTSEEARVHPRRNVITRALGTSGKVECDIITLELFAKDIVFISSDGLHGLVPDIEIKQALTDLPFKKGVSWLMNRALENGGTDNVTIAAGLIR